MAITSPAFRYHGGKFRLAPWILGFFPKHTCYTEAFGGAAGVLLQKQRSYSEVYNDLDGDVVNFFRVMQQAASRVALIEAIIMTPYARAEFEKAWRATADPIERARRLCIRAQMGFGSAGATKGATGFRIDTKRNWSTSQHLWVKYPDAIAEVGIRFQGVLIENRPAIEILKQHDDATTLHFIDPPYLHSVRKLRGSEKGHYKHEMTEAQHVELIECARELQGMAIICGYDSELYNDLLGDWERHERRSRISAGKGTAVRTEVIWINPVAHAARHTQFIPFT